MGTGRELGRQLGAALRDGSLPPEPGRALANRLGDWLGADRSLEAPLRDLVSRQRFQQALAREGPSRRRTLSDLAAELSQTYAPRVQQELVELLEATFEEPGLSPPQGPDVPPVAGPATRPPLRRRRPQSIGAALRREGPALGAELRSFSAGMALAAAAAAVLSWLAEVLAGTWPGPWTDRPGVFLAGCILLAQLVTISRLRPWRRRLALDAAHCSEPRRAWHWVSAPWIHRHDPEALLHALVLLVVLGSSPLPLADAVLRFSLTALATMAASALTARRLGLASACWAGASGPVSALLALPVTLSLLQRRELSFALGTLSVPAWVPFLVCAALQLSWILPRQDAQDGSHPRQRLLGSTWWWGLVFGTGWGLLTWGRLLIESWMPVNR